MKRFLGLSIVLILILSLAGPLTVAEDLQRYKDVEGTVKLDFYFVVGVAGPLATVMDNMVEQFNEEHPNIKVNPVYCGNYNDTMAKVQSAILSGNPPEVFVVEISELYTLLGIDGIIPLDKYIEKEGGEEFTSQYFQALYGNAKAKGHIWGQPFQRSTPILYYNKDLFAKNAEELRAVGLDPNRAPRTWFELERYAEILTERKNGKTKTWGLILPGGWNDWIFEGFTYQNGLPTLIEDGEVSHFDSLKVRQALKFWYKLTNEIKASPPLKPWTETPMAFNAGNVGMMYYSTGGLPLVRKQSDFDFGVAFQPMHVEYGVPVGGGDFHISKGISPEKQDAAWEFIKFMTSPEMAAYWSRESGYICINKKGLELPEMQEYLEKYPNASVAADQLQVAHSKIMAPGFQEIRKTFVANLDKLMQGKQGPIETQKKLHKEVQNILDQY
ncbi:ABC transporter substrate-binding protein [Candidatus Bipolaricaulota bacterium]|nr:ABC transporter substrate-binding protein [Candidatus Bipolaricaulota bacterium]